MKILVLGGAKSGKSDYAQKLAEDSEPGSPLIFVATAEVGDDEMADRVAAHKAARGERWQTIEEPLAVDEILVNGRSGQVYLVDCLTLWLSNRMAASLGRGHEVGDGISRLVESFEKCRASVIMVANEVGLGIVPQNKLARHFRDLAGRLNQQAAAAADRVWFVAAGLPMKLK